MDADKFEGQFKYTRGHSRSNCLSVLYGLQTWWMESSFDTITLGKSVIDHPRSPEVKQFTIVKWTGMLTEGIILGC